MEAKITGNVSCNDLENLKLCKKVLNRFYIQYECKDTNIDIDCNIKVKASFDSKGLNRLLHYKLNTYGKANINVGEII